MVKVGLEIHGYLNTKEKLFCKCKSEHGAKFSKPNTNICPVCTGMPGAKPMLPNSNAVGKAIEISLILECKINQKLAWQRKHYDWPDMPKGFQSTISGPYATPVGVGGKFLGIGITEAHLEEDPAAWNPQTGEIDYNRSGSPLIEIVTEPDFKSAEQVVSWLKQLIVTLDYIKAIDKNSGIKVDVNVSVPEMKTERVEIKNVNSMSNIINAINYEEKRQKKEGQKVRETRMYDESKGVTIKMREKELAEDYRFISEPDLPVLKIEKNRIEKIRASLPETPHEKLARIVKKHKIKKEYAEILTKKLDIVEFFEKIIGKVQNPELAVHWVAGELSRVLNYAKKEIADVDINPEHFVELLKMMEQNAITALKAKEILNEFIPKSFSPKEKIKSHAKISSGEIEEICEKVIKENPKAVQDYKQGNASALNFLLGQIMKNSNKRADSKTAREILERMIK
ncbi:Asp-tRNA(Asn)/Glu-tRNA(Gln) amidotransferase subunit GatB [Candidatus Pacearchaeota archaeon]|nr:Asp-tRNA(Asn)/Glu-tRNA(Gln) amidotransferase subunit GatB [Candidatus Pacearchaeota archaeon]